MIRNIPLQVLKNVEELIDWLELKMTVLNSIVPYAELLMAMEYPPYYIKKVRDVIISDHYRNALKDYHSKSGIFERFLRKTTNTVLKERGQKLLFTKFTFDMYLQQIDHAYASLQLLREVSDDDFFYHVANIIIGMFLYSYYRYTLEHDKRREEIRTLTKSINYRDRDERTNGILNRILNSYKNELEKESKRIDSPFYSLRYRLKQYHHFG